MRNAPSILLVLPLLDLVFLVPLERLMGHWLWVFLLASALLGLGLLKLARQGLGSSNTRLLSARHLSALIDGQRTVMAGMLFVWPGVLSDLAAIVLLLTSPVLATPSGRDHPVRIKDRR